MGGFYIVGARVKQLVGTARIRVDDDVVTGADYQSGDLDSVSPTYETKAMIVEVDDPAATGITPQFLGVANLDSIKIDHAFMYELNTDPIGNDTGDRLILTPTPVQTVDPAHVSLADAATGTYMSTTVTTLADRPSYIEVTGYINMFLVTGASRFDLDVTLERDIDAAASWADVAGEWATPASNDGAVIPIHYIDWTPGLDEDHEFRVKIVNGTGQNLWINGNATTAYWTSALTVIVRPKI